VLTCLAAPLPCQTGVGREFGRGTLTAGWSGVLDCLQCSVHLSPTGTWVEFGAEPVVRGVGGDGNVLANGDVLVAVDNLLITTAAAGRRIANLDGTPGRFTIRRGGKEMVLMVPRHFEWQFGLNDQSGFLPDAAPPHPVPDPFYLGAPPDSSGAPAEIRFVNVPRGATVRIYTSGGVLVRILQAGPTPATTAVRWDLHNRNNQLVSSGVYYYDVEANGKSTTGKLTIVSNSGETVLPPGAAALLKRPALQDTAPASPILMDRETTRGWLGIALSCERCSLDGLDHTSSNKQRLFTTPPFVMAVDVIGAAQNRFKIGDVIRSIDGLSMTSPEGGTRFSNLKAGERVRFVVERRDDKPGTIYDPTGVNRLVTLEFLVPKRP